MPHAIKRLAIVAALMGAVAAALAAFAPAVRSDEPVMRLRAFAVNMSGVGRTRATTLDIVIERWSTDDERKLILDTLIERAPEKLLDVVQDIKPRAGYIRTSTSLGWHIQFATQGELPGGGTRVVFATDRPMSFFESVNRPRSSQYEYMVGEIRLGRDGKGEGKLATAAKVRYDRKEGQIEIENYGIEPVRLSEVTTEHRAAME